MSRTPRRTFLKRTAAALAGLSLAPGWSESTGCKADGAGVVPWYRRTLRWGQTNITELDPAAYDVPWWRQQWKRTRLQGVIVNAGGIVAYYPSKFPLHYRPPLLGDRDLYGELARAGHADGLMVLARMDSNRTHEAFFKAHPDWFARDAAGQPYRAGELYVTCVNSPYYEDYIPSILRELIERSRPEGMTDNSWSGLGRENICHCHNCVKKFRERTGKAIPAGKNWDDPGYREWIRWNYARRLEIWELNNRATRAAGGPDCLWVGMNSGSVSGQCRSFRDFPEICRRAEIILLDHQARGEAAGFQENAEAGQLVHGLLGWEKLIPESMAMYQAGRPTFRKASKPEPEARLWMLEGFAGTLQPWWHHVGAYQEDRRQYWTAEPINRWHQAHQEYLVQRQPVACVGLVWSQQNTDYYGRDDPEALVELPFRGMADALVRARIPYLPVHADHIRRDGRRLSVLVFPNVAVLSECQCLAVRQFVQRGGNVIATGQTSLYNPEGQTHPDFALADLFGAHVASDRTYAVEAALKQARETVHSYLRLPELRARGGGPRLGTEPPVAGKRHPALEGFEETDLLPFGGRLGGVRAEAGAEVLATFVPPFPIYPPETSWMREPRTTIPGLIVRTTRQGGRIAYLLADLDRRYGRDHLPDHGNLLANLVRWAAGDTFPLTVRGPGLVDCHLYRQTDRLVLHLVNLSSAGMGRGPVEEFLAVGPLFIRVRLPNGVRISRVKLLVSGQKPAPTLENGEAVVQLASLLDHEVIVLE
jgi:hypothetical protein